jgi:hypothetical protein
MSISLLDDKRKRPAPRTLAAALGDLARLWNEIVEYVKAQFPSAAEEWKFPGAKYGWSFRLKDKRRNLIYMTPAKGFIQVAFVFGDKAVEDVLASWISSAIKTELKNAHKYVEGRGIRLPVRTTADWQDVKRLVDIKLRN